MSSVPVQSFNPFRIFDREVELRFTIRPRDYDKYTEEQLHERVPCQLRTFVIDKKLHFVVKDSCSLLGITPNHASRAIESIDPCYVRKEYVQIEVAPDTGASSKRTSKYTGEVYLITEPGLYALIQKSRTVYAEEFKRWLNEEVLPSVRPLFETNQILTKTNIELTNETARLTRHLDEYKQAAPVNIRTDRSMCLNDISVVCRASDGYVDATEFCRAGGKQFKHWYELKRAKRVIEAVANRVGIPAGSLIILGHGDTNESGAQHTWVHRKILYDIAVWISPEFAAQVHDWLDELFLTGHVTLGHERSLHELEELHMKQIRDLNSQFESIKTKLNTELDQERRERCQAVQYKEHMEHETEKYFIQKLCRKWRAVDLSKFARSCCIYLVYVGEYINKDGLIVHVFKFGRSEDLITRIATHKHTFEFAALVFCHKVLSGLFVENMIKEFARLHGLKCEIAITDDHTETEVVMTNSDVSIIDVISELTLMCNQSLAFSETDVILLGKDKEIADCRRVASEYKARAELAEIKVKLLEHGIHL